MFLLLWNPLARLHFPALKEQIGDSAGSMDALSCTTAVIGRSSKIAVALKGRQNNAQNATGSVQVCASSRNGNANGGSVESTSSVGTLPSPSSRSLFPSRLRFIWFNKRSQGNVGENFESDSHIYMLNEELDANLGLSLGNGAENGEKGKPDGPDCELIVRGDPGLTFAENIANVQKCEVHALGESFAGRSDDESSAESGDDARDIKAGENADGRRAGSPTNAIRRRDRGNWVGRILELRSLWKDRRNDSNEATEQCHSQGLQDSSPSKNADPCDKCECGCADCSTDDNRLSSPNLEVPRIEANHDRDSFSRFLHQVSLLEIKLFGRLSYLCNLAYVIPEIKPRYLLKVYRLRLITSSLDKKVEADIKAKESIITDNVSSPSAALGTKDGCRSTDQRKRRIYVSPSVAYEIAAAAASYLLSQTKYILPFKSMHGRVADDGNEKLNSDTRQDENGDHDNHLTNNKGTKDAEVAMVNEGYASNPGTKPKFTISSAQVEGTNDLSILSKSEVASFIATTSVTSVVAAKEETKQAVAKDLQSIQSSPCEWFICDDDMSHTRFFVIQGSETLASWKANLFFEPIQFEGFDVLVHRGIYEAAKGIYEQILPEVHDHVKTFGQAARLRFTGHSLGGSLSVLLNLMLLIRGVVPATSLLPVITFGSPCIMCGGDYLLQKLGLPYSHIQSVMMHRDIVPRAFACNYPDHVAEILKRLNANFRSHPCLNSQRFLYAPMGQLLILQPDEKTSVPHHLLPSGSGLYLLRHLMHIENGHEPSRAAQVRAAQITFLNSPHPLETLSDPGAYGSEGSITRNHDSKNYLTTIRHVLRKELKRLRRLRREQRRQMWWPLVAAESSILTQRSYNVGISVDTKTFVGAVGAVKTAPSQAPRRFEFPLRACFMLQCSKDTLRRFARLIASQHVQLGIMFLLSAGVLI